MTHSRRSFLQVASLGLSGASFAIGEEKPSVVGEIGVTTGSFMSYIAYGAGESGKIRMLDLPRLMNNELGLRVIDFMSRTLDSFEPVYLEKLRNVVEKNGCIATNLKCNQKGIDLASPDDATRQEALRIYKESIGAAEMLGCRWIRPVAGAGKNPDRNRVADSLRELIDYGAPRGITILIENTGWISNSPDNIPNMIARVGEGLAASPDTGNWPNDDVRYPGLEKAYPFAVTSDFKAFQFEPDGSHPKYDLKKCFDTGWDAGFRGPWCIEHFHENLPGLLAGFAEVRDRLKRWKAEREE